MIKKINSNGYTQKQVAELLKIKPKTVAFYTIQGLVIPEIANPKGRGTTRIYSKYNLLQILILRYLGDYGISLGRAKKIIKDYDKYWEYTPFIDISIDLRSIYKQFDKI